METDLDITTLIQRNEHLNVLRYIRVHKLREAGLVLTHGRALLGPDFGRTLSDEVARLAVLEQVCLAAIDQQDHDTSELCLSKLTNAGVAKDSMRFRLLLARCLEAAGDYSAAESLYEVLLRENPANLMVLRRKYCILKAQVGKSAEAIEALNHYLKQNLADTAAWYELARLRMEIGDFKGAAFCLEEVLVGSPTDAAIHCELAECYATVGGMGNLGLARKHMAQALELNANLRRAQVGLVSVANAYLEEAEKAGKKQSVDEFEVEVSKELVKYGAEQLLTSYAGTELFASIKSLMKEYTV
jgi:ER membrane protein complex subunit 2